jgi:hypothetical protein
MQLLSANRRLIVDIAYCKEHEPLVMCFWGKMKIIILDTSAENNSGRGHG